MGISQKYFPGILSKKSKAIQIRRKKATKWNWIFLKWFYVGSKHLIYQGISLALLQKHKIQCLHQARRLYTKTPIVSLSFIGITPSPQMVSYYSSSWFFFKVCDEKQLKESCPMFAVEIFLRTLLHISLMWANYLHWFLKNSFLCVKNWCEFFRKLYLPSFLLWLPGTSHQHLRIIIANLLYFIVYIKYYFKIH